MVEGMYRPSTVPIARIKKLPDLESLFPRPENRDEICDDIRNRGIQEALVVNPENILVDGFTRLEIAHDLKLREVPVRIIPYTNVLDLKEYAIRQNFHRRQLTKLQLVEICGIPLEEIEAERARLRMESGMPVDPVANFATGSTGKTRDKVGGSLGMSGRSYSSYRKIALNGSRTVKELVNSGSLTQATALNLVRLPEQQQELLLSRLKTNPEEANPKRIGRRIDQYLRREKESQVRKAHAEAAKSGDMSRYKDSIAAGVVAYESGSWIVKTPLNKPLPGVEVPYPRYSGQETLPIGIATWFGIEEELGTPIFSDNGWEELNSYTNENEESILGALFPELRFSSGGPGYLYETPLVRRTYDPEYGGFVMPNTDSTWDRWHSFAKERCNVEGNYKWSREPAAVRYVRKRWGSWVILEFNDGKGGRERRRFFEHDCIGHTLCELAFATFDTTRFTQVNARQLQIFNVPKYEASWFAFRRATIPIQTAVVALEADLAALKVKASSHQSDEEIASQAIEWLENFHVLWEETSEWREGCQTFPRTPDGTLDRDALQMLTAEDRY